MDNTTKRLLLNHQIFMEKLLANQEFFLEIIKWKDRLQVTKKDLGNFFDTDKRTWIEARKHGIRLMERIFKEENVEFISWLSDFCLKYKLGTTWEQSIIDYIACGYYCPPTTSIVVKANKQREVVIVELNSDTSEEEFEAAWNKVREAQKELPHRIKRRFSKRSFANFEKILKRNHLKSELGLKELELIAHLYPEDGNDTDNIPLKEMDEKLLKKLKIQRQRTNRRGYIKKG